MLLCGPCLRHVWRDFTKLEEFIIDHHARNQAFPAFAVREVRRLQPSSSDSAMVE